MDFSEQEVDLFGDDEEEEDYQNDDDQQQQEPPPREPNEEEEESRRSSSASSSSSSSAAASSSSASSSNRSSGSGSGSASGGDDDDEDNNDNGGEVRSGYYSVENEDKDLFGSDNEDYCKTLASSPFVVPGNFLPSSKGCGKKIQFFDSFCGFSIRLLFCCWQIGCCLKVSLRFASNWTKVEQHKPTSPQQHPWTIVGMKWTIQQWLKLGKK